MESDSELVSATMGVHSGNRTSCTHNYVMSALPEVSYHGRFYRCACVDITVDDETKTRTFRYTYYFQHAGVQICANRIPVTMESAHEFLETYIMSSSPTDPVNLDRVRGLDMFLASALLDVVKQHTPSANMPADTVTTMTDEQVQTWGSKFVKNLGLRNMWRTCGMVLRMDTPIKESDDVFFDLVCQAVIHGKEPAIALLENILEQDCATAKGQQRIHRRLTEPLSEEILEKLWPNYIPLIRRYRAMMATMNRVPSPGPVFSNGPDDTNPITIPVYEICSTLRSHRISKQEASTFFKYTIADDDDATVDQNLCFYLAQVIARMAGSPLAKDPSYLYKALLPHGLRLHTTPHCILVLAEKGHMQACQLIIQHDPDAAFAKDPITSLPAIHFACHSGNLALVQWWTTLYEQKEERQRVRTAAQSDDTRMGQVATLEELTCADNAQTLLHAAARGGHDLIVDWLVETQGFKVDHADRKDRRPLHVAAKAGHFFMWRKLCTHASQLDIWFGGKYKRSFRHYAREAGFKFTDFPGNSL